MIPINARPLLTVTAFPRTWHAVPQAERLAEAAAEELMDEMMGGEVKAKREEIVTTAPEGREGVEEDQGAQEQQVSARPGGRRGDGAGGLR